MEQSKKVTILLILLVVLGVLVFVFYQKYKPSSEINTYNVNDDTKEVTDEPKQELTPEQKELITKLYNKVSINNASTECLDYYVTNTITLDNMTDELLSYLVLKNMNLVPSQDAEPIEKSKIENVLKDLFNNSDNIKNSYTAKIGNYKYELKYDVDFSTYVISSSEADTYNHVLERELSNSIINDNNIKIEEKFILINDGTTKIEGKLIYTFNKINNNYYLYSIDRNID